MEANTITAKQVLTDGCFAVDDAGVLTSVIKTSIPQKGPQSASNHTLAGRAPNEAGPMSKPKVVSLLHPPPSQKHSTIATSSTDMVSAPNKPQNFKLKISQGGGLRLSPSGSAATSVGKMSSGQDDQQMFFIRQMTAGPPQLCMAFSSQPNKLFMLHASAGQKLNLKLDQTTPPSANPQNTTPKTTAAAAGVFGKACSDTPASLLGNSSAKHPTGLILPGKQTPIQISGVTSLQSLLKRGNTITSGAMPDKGNSGDRQRSKLPSSLTNIADKYIAGRPQLAHTVQSGYSAFVEGTEHSEAPMKTEPMHRTILTQKNRQPAGASLLTGALAKCQLPTEEEQSASTSSTETAEEDAGNEDSDSSAFPFKIASVFSLADQELQPDDSYENQISEEIDEKPMKVEDFCQNHSLTQDQMLDMCGSAFVVLERLDQKSIEERRRNQDLSRCSDYCRKRTLNYLCMLNLIRCHPTKKRRIQTGDDESGSFKTEDARSDFVQEKEAKASEAEHFEAADPNKKNINFGVKIKQEIDSHNTGSMGAESFAGCQQSVLMPSSAHGPLPGTPGDLLSLQSVCDISRQNKERLAANKESTSCHDKSENPENRPPRLKSLQPKPNKLQENDVVSAVLGNVTVGMHVSSSQVTNVENGNNILETQRKENLEGISTTHVRKPSPPCDIYISSKLSTTVSQTLPDVLKSIATTKTESTSSSDTSVSHQQLSSSTTSVSQAVSTNVAVTGHGHSVPPSCYTTTTSKVVASSNAVSRDAILPVVSLLTSKGVHSVTEQQHKYTLSSPSPGVQSVLSKLLESIQMPMPRPAGTTVQSTQGKVIPAASQPLTQASGSVPGPSSQSRAFLVPTSLHPGGHYLVVMNGDTVSASSPSLGTGCTVSPSWSLPISGVSGAGVKVQQAVSGCASTVVSPSTASSPKLVSAVPPGTPHPVASVNLASSIASSSLVSCSTSAPPAVSRSLSASSPVTFSLLSRPIPAVPAKTSFSPEALHANQNRKETATNAGLLRFETPSAGQSILKALVPVSSQQNSAGNTKDTRPVMKLVNAAQGAFTRPLQTVPCLDSKRKTMLTDCAVPADHGAKGPAPKFHFKVVKATSTTPSHDKRLVIHVPSFARTRPGPQGPREPPQAQPRAVVVNLTNATDQSPKATSTVAQQLAAKRSIAASRDTVDESGKTRVSVSSVTPSTATAAGFIVEKKSSAADKQPHLKIQHLVTIPKRTVPAFPTASVSALPQQSSHPQSDCPDPSEFTPMTTASPTTSSTPKAPHTSMPAPLLPETSKRATIPIDNALSEVEAKRARFEKRYPLPPGVVIKAEPVTFGYETDKSAEDDAPDGIVEETQRLNTAASSSSRIQIHVDQTRGTSVCSVEPASGNSLSNVDSASATDPPEISPCASPPGDRGCPDLGVSEDAQDGGGHDEMPVLRPVSPLPRAVHAQRSATQGPSDGGASVHPCPPKSRRGRPRKIRVASSSDDATAGVASPYCQNNQTTPNLQTQSQPMPSTSSAVQSAPSSSSSSNNRIQQLKDMLKLQNEQLEKIRQQRAMQAHSSFSMDD